MADPNVDRTEAYARALLEVARAEGMLGEVEDDLFRFARVFEGTDGQELPATISRSTPGRRRSAVPTSSRAIGAECASGPRPA